LPSFSFESLLVFCSLAQAAAQVATQNGGAAYSKTLYQNITESLSRTPKVVQKKKNTALRIRSNFELLNFEKMAEKKQRTAEKRFRFSQTMLL
jgi:hypothetical protein